MVEMSGLGVAGWSSDWKGVVNEVITSRLAWHVGVCRDPEGGRACFRGVRRFFWFFLVIRWIGVREKEMRKSRAKGAGPREGLYRNHPSRFSSLYIIMLFNSWEWK